MSHTKNKFQLNVCVKLKKKQIAGKLAFTYTSLCSNLTFSDVKFIPLHPTLDKPLFPSLSVPSLGFVSLKLLSPPDLLLYTCLFILCLFSHWNGSSTRAEMSFWSWLYLCYLDLCLPYPVHLINMYTIDENRMKFLVFTTNK